MQGGKLFQIQATRSVKKLVCDIHATYFYEDLVRVSSSRSDIIS